MEKGKKGRKWSKSQNKGRDFGKVEIGGEASRNFKMSSVNKQFQCKMTLFAASFAVQISYNSNWTPKCNPPRTQDT